MGVDPVAPLGAVADAAVVEYDSRLLRPVLAAGAGPQERFQMLLSAQALESVLLRQVMIEARRQIRCIAHRQIAFKLMRLGVGVIRMHLDADIRIRLDALDQQRKDRSGQIAEQLAVLLPQLAQRPAVIDTIPDPAVRPWMGGDAPVLME